MFTLTDNSPLINIFNGIFVLEQRHIIRLYVYKKYYTTKTDDSMYNKKRHIVFDKKSTDKHKKFSLVDYYMKKRQEHSQKVKAERANTIKFSVKLTPAQLRNFNKQKARNRKFYNLVNSSVEKSLTYKKRFYKSGTNHEDNIYNNALRILDKRLFSLRKKEWRNNSRHYNNYYKINKYSRFINKANFFSAREKGYKKFRPVGWPFRRIADLPARKNIYRKFLKFCKLKKLPKLRLKKLLNKNSGPLPNTKKFFKRSGSAVNKKKIVRIRSKKFLKRKKSALKKDLMPYNFNISLTDVFGNSTHQQGFYKGLFFTFNLIHQLSYSKCNTFFSQFDYKNYWSPEILLKYNIHSIHKFYDTLLTEQRVLTNFLNFAYNIVKGQYIFFADFGLKYQTKFLSKQFFYFFEDTSIGYNYLYNSYYSKLLLDRTLLMNKDVKTKIFVHSTNILAENNYLIRPSLSFFYKFMVNFYLTLKNKFISKLGNSLYFLDHYISITALLADKTSSYDWSQIYNISQYQHIMTSDFAYHSFFLNSFIKEPQSVGIIAKYFIYYKSVVNRNRLLGLKLSAFWASVKIKSKFTEYTYFNIDNSFLNSYFVLFFLLKNILKFCLMDVNFITDKFSTYFGVFLVLVLKNKSFMSHFMRLSSLISVKTSPLASSINTAYLQVNDILINWDFMLYKYNSCIVNLPDPNSFINTDLKRNMHVFFKYDLMLKSYYGKKRKWSKVEFVKTFFFSKIAALRKFLAIIANLSLLTFAKTEKKIKLNWYLHFFIVRLFKSLKLRNKTKSILKSFKYKSRAISLKSYKRKLKRIFFKKYRFMLKQRLDRFKLYLQYKKLLSNLLKFYNKDKNTLNLLEKYYKTKHRNQLKRLFESKILYNKILVREFYSNQFKITKKSGLFKKMVKSLKSYKAKQRQRRRKKNSAKPKAKGFPRYIYP